MPRLPPRAPRERAPGAGRAPGSRRLPGGQAAWRRAAGGKHRDYLKLRFGMYRPKFSLPIQKMEQLITNFHPRTIREPE